MQSNLILIKVYAKYKCASYCKKHKRNKARLCTAEGTWNLTRVEA